MVGSMKMIQRHASVMLSQQVMFCSWLLQDATGTGVCIPEQIQREPQVCNYPRLHVIGYIMIRILSVFLIEMYICKVLTKAPWWFAYIPRPQSLSRQKTCSFWLLSRNFHILNDMLDHQLILIACIRFGIKFHHSALHWSWGGSNDSIFVNEGYSDCLNGPMPCCDWQLL